MLVLTDEGKDNNKLAYSPSDDPEVISTYCTMY